MSKHKNELTDLSTEALRASEQRFRMIADQTPVMIWLTDEHGLCTYLNKRWYEFTGQPDGQAERRGWLLWVHPDDRARIEADDIRVSTERRAFKFEYRLRQADGAYRWVVDSGNPHYSDDGTFMGFIGTVVDITDRKEAEDILKRHNEELEERVALRTAELDRIWRLTPDMLVVVNLDGYFIDVNPAAGAILGWSRDELLTVPFAELVHPDDRDATLSEYRRRKAGHPSTGSFENRFRHKDGSYRWIAWTSVVADGRIYATGRDQTDLKAKTEALEAAEEALRQAQKMEAVGQLTGGIAHDFNNLLTVVIGNIDSVRRRLSPESAEPVGRAIESAMQGARRAAALTQRLLAFARRQPLNPKPIDLSQTVLSLSDLLTRTLGERIEIQTVFGTGLWRVEVDPNQLESTLLNLALNARDAMPHGGKLIIETANAEMDGSVLGAVSAIEAGQYVSLAVIDTGHGMDPETVGRVFEPFFTTKPFGEGTGLGLSQVYGFVKQSGGHIQLHSAIGQGTTVKIYLPRLLKDIRDDEHAAAISAPGGAAHETVLVVEDQAAVREYTCEVLRELGYTVLDAHDGQSGLQRLYRHPEIRVLFTDMGLPGMTGRELASKALAMRPHLKVLFTTGYARDANPHQGRIEGIELLTKPFTYADLAAKLRDLIEGDV